MRIFSHSNTIPIILQPFFALSQQNLPLFCRNMHKTWFFHRKMLSIFPKRLYNIIIRVPLHNSFRIKNDIKSICRRILKYLYFAFFFLCKRSSLRRQDRKTAHSAFRPLGDSQLVFNLPHIASVVHRVTAHLCHLGNIVALDRDQNDRVEEFRNFRIDPALVQVFEVDDDEVFCVCI